MRFKQFLKESSENTFKVFRGFTYNDSSLSLEIVSTGNPNYGPGIYFSSSSEDAKKYGKYILEAELTLSKTVSYQDKPSEDHVKSLLKNSPNFKNTIKDKFQDSFKEALEHYGRFTNEKDAFVNIFKDFYAPHYGRQFCVVMKNLGFDAMKSPENPPETFVVYNLKAIKKIKFEEAK